MALSSHKTTFQRLKSMQIHADFKVKKTTSLSWILTFYTFAIHVLYFAVQYVEEYNIKWAVGQTYLLSI